MATLLLSSLSPIIAQTNSVKDTTQKKDSPIIDFKNKLKSVQFKLSDKSLTKPLNITPKKKPFEFKASDRNFYNYFNKQPKHVFNIYGDKPAEPDVLVRHFFNGKETTNQKPETDYSLGTYYSSSKYVILEFRDFGLIDGDRIKVYLNQKIINSDIRLDGVAYSVKIALTNGFNRIDIKALSDGFVGPNTAELNVIDDQGKVISTQKWNIETGQFATLSLIRK